MSGAAEQAKMVEDAVAALVSHLGCTDRAVVKSEEVVRDGEAQGITITVEPVVEGPVPMWIMVEGETITLGWGKMGIMEFFDKDPTKNVSDLMAIFGHVMENEMVEDIHVGILRVVARNTLITSTGRESFGYHSSWRSSGDRSEVLHYSPYVSP